MRVNVVVNAHLQSSPGRLGHVVLERGILSGGARVAHRTPGGTQHSELNSGSLDLSPVHRALGVRYVNALDSDVGGVLAVLAVGDRIRHVPVAVVYQTAALGYREPRRPGFVVPHRALEYEHAAVDHLTGKREVTCLGGTSVDGHREVSAAYEPSGFRCLEVAGDLHF